MSLESVTRADPAGVFHEAVADDLGDDGGRGNGQADLIAVDDRPRWNGTSDIDRAIDEDEIRLTRKVEDGSGQGPKGGLEDIIPIDAVM